MSDKVFFAEGNDAFYFGDEQTDCPYAEGSRERLLWLDGWQEAQHDAERKYLFSLDPRLPVPMFGVKSKGASRSR